MSVDPPSSSTSPPVWSNPNSLVPESSEIHDTYSNNNDTSDDFLTKPYSTLDEPVTETIMRDVRSVTMKLKVVLLQKPFKSASANTNPLQYVTVSMNEDQVSQDEDQKKVLSTLRDWDLWGPLIVCLLLSILLSLRAPEKQASGVFAAVFCSMWMGSAVVTVNAKLLGGTISFFQSVCVLGYCVSPFCLAALVTLALNKTFLAHVWINILWVAVAFVWATRASAVFIGQFIQKERRLLAVFPVFFYYTLIGWLVLLFWLTDTTYNIWQHRKTEWRRMNGEPSVLFIIHYIGNSSILDAVPNSRLEERTWQITKYSRTRLETDYAHWRGGDGRFYWTLRKEVLANSPMHLGYTHS